MKFTEKLKNLRETNKYTQRQIAIMLGIDVAAYNRYEKGERCMKQEMVDKIAEIYHISAEELRKYWLAGQIFSLLYNEENINDIITIVAEDISEYGIKSKED